MSIPALDLTGLTAEANRNDSVDDSAKTVITRLLDDVAQANAQASGNQAAVDAVVAQWRASTDGLAAAIANVPA